MNWIVDLLRTFLMINAGLAAIFSLCVSISYALRQRVRRAQGTSVLLPHYLVFLTSVGCFLLGLETVFEGFLQWGQTLSWSHYLGILGFGLLSHGCLKMLKAMV